MNHYRFSPPSSATEWKAYDDIRREVLFEARGRFGVYKENHPDEFVPKNHPFLLYFRDIPIGVIRIDLPDQQQAIFRLVAIKQTLQRQGHGSTIMKMAEDFAIDHQRNLFVLNSALEAIQFYEKLGYALDPCSPENDPLRPRMIKCMRVDGEARGTLATE